MKHRAEQFLRLAEKKTYREIGLKFGVSRTLVYLELKKYFPKEIKEVLANRKFFSKKGKKPFTKGTCLYCGKNFTSKYRYITPKFCNKECMKAFSRDNWNYEKKK